MKILGPLSGWFDTKVVKGKNVGQEVKKRLMLGIDACCFWTVCGVSETDNLGAECKYYPKMAVLLPRACENYEINPGATVEYIVKALGGSEATVPPLVKPILNKETLVLTDLIEMGRIIDVSYHSNFFIDDGIPQRYGIGVTNDDQSKGGPTVVKSKRRAGFLPRVSAR